MEHSTPKTIRRRIARLIAGEPKTCLECGSRVVPSPTGTKCETCITDYVQAIHRRREAERRLPPLEGQDTSAVSR